MDNLEPQRRKNESSFKGRAQIPAQNKKEEEEFPVVEGMTERDFKSDDFQQSPLKLFFNTIVTLLVAGLVIGMVYYFFFHGNVAG